MTCLNLLCVKEGEDSLRENVMVEDLIMVARIISAFSVFIVAAVGGILTLLPTTSESNGEKHFMYRF